MKLIFIFLTILNTYSLFGGLKVEQTVEAMIKAQFQKNEYHFAYTLCEDPILLNNAEKGSEVGAENEQYPNPKVYGPYQLTLKGLKPGTRFDIYEFNLLGVEKPHFVFSGYIDKHDEAWINVKGGDMKLFERLNYFRWVLPGEPIYSMVVLRGSKTYIAACLVPNPLEAFGKEKRHVSMEFLMMHEPAYVVRGKNFEPGEEITMLIHSKNNTSIEYLEALDDGTFSLLLEGDRSQNELGAESIQIYTANQITPMTITYGWECWNFLEKVIPSTLEIKK